VNLEFFDAFPKLETARLQLRELLKEDAAALFELFRDDEVTRYHDLEAMPDVAAAASIIARIRQRYRDRGGIRWAILDKADSSFVGTIGFNSINVSAHRAVLGYEIARRAWGQGFATEAVRALVEFGHQRIGFNRIEAGVMLGNEASMRVLRKAGFEPEGIARAFGYWKGGYHDLQMFSILRLPASESTSSA
jgi:[ribosomal protein S5]-alanine N-acetyltransferase